MKFRARYLLECEIELSAKDVHAAEKDLRAQLAVAEIGDILRSTRILGLIPASEPWPNTVAAEQPVPRPPRNTPPSGTPGTPTARLDAVMTEARAA